MAVKATRNIHGPGLANKAIQHRRTSFAAATLTFINYVSL